MAQRVALVFGASGISSWAQMHDLLDYPTSDTFARIVALSNRPLARDRVQLNDPRLEFYSGVDLTLPVESVVKKLQATVRNVHEVTHVYWYAYIHDPPEKSLTEANGDLLDTTLCALKEATPRMVHFIFQTGSKYYGVMSSAEMPPAPIKETVARRPEPWVSSIFYYKQLDVISKHTKTANWRWNDVRPDAIIGYAPTVNAMNLALVLGIYLSLYRAVHGRNAAVPCPASIAGANALTTESLSDQCARLAIWLSLQDNDALNGRSFNIGTKPSTYAERWPAIAGAWGLEGVQSQQEDTNPIQASIDVSKWAREHVNDWLKLEKEHGLQAGVLDKAGFDFLVVMSVPNDRQLDLTSIREAGWMEEGDPIAAYNDAWARFAQAKFIPPM